MVLCGSLVLTSYLLWSCVAVWFSSLLAVFSNLVLSSYGVLWQFGPHLLWLCVVFWFPSPMEVCGNLVLTLCGVGSLVPISYGFLWQFGFHLLWGFVEHTPWSHVQKGVHPSAYQHSTCRGDYTPCTDV